MGIPCKHRIHVLKGHTYQIIDITPAIEQAVELAAAIIKGSDIPGYIERYENLKKEIKTNNENSEKVFRKYRSAIIEHALNKGTAKEAKKASADLDKALQDCLNTEVEAESLLQAIKTVFIRHSSC